MSSELQPCPKNCPKIKNPPDSESDLFPGKVSYKTGDLPIDFDEHWELVSFNGGKMQKHTAALSRTEQGARDFKDGIVLCPGPKEVKVFGITLFRKCQNPSKNKDNPSPPKLRAV